MIPKTYLGCDEKEARNKKISFKTLNQTTFETKESTHPAPVDRPNALNLFSCV